MANALIAALLFILGAGCLLAAPPPPPARDLGILQTEVAGLRVGLSPRRVAQEAAKAGWREDRLSSKTIEDVIQETDKGPPPTTPWLKADTSVTFEVKSPRAGTVDVHFCGSQVSFIRFSYEIAAEERNRTINTAMSRMNALGDTTVKEEELSYRLVYQPNKRGHVAFTVYKTIKDQRGFRVWDDVYDSTSCY